ncbi:glucose-6-phosphate dehydrogenase [Metabacillus sediminilitoris]|uniref:Glucose-6-phosphate 1-dehydrogenase n=1 Tax=Metabacillus sediminilitoris TaxID=2567941 RepID=A0A4S4C419_9BACI|nr:glucose-6-phosphate dehydrogenase [Metabacillus sediminilitoris]QGQ45256.1 glucose-6-phosphate dehydrogenase [Metabacillus sediminilitoris]THF82445.1 glucose-6-phosphate dehydrogenase [Metabacillus sediminilitoris]
MESMTFILFGATGDLAKRKIFPALYNLFLDQKMPDSISIIGLGRREMSDREFQNQVEQSLRTFSRRIDFDRTNLYKFLDAFRYSEFNAVNPEDYRKLLSLVKQRENERNIPENRMFYLSVAPEFFDLISLNIKESGLGSTKGWKRLIIEKPFGRDLESARELNTRLSEAFEEDEIYRIDHYLGKPMVQNLEALKFANPILQPLWNNQHIANIQITASEVVGVEERAGYYDQAGAIRDMFQNHMLQMLMMTAMNQPKKMNANEIRNEKRKIIESLRGLKKEDVSLHVVRGQYRSGEAYGMQLAGYTEEPGVNPTSKNDTFVAAKVMIDNENWQGVPFYIRTGKRMKIKSTRIVIEFKDSLKELYENKNEKIIPNLLIIEINPNENITLQLNHKNPLHDGKIEPVKINFSAEQKGVPEAYERLIFDAFRGDSTFFAHWKEVEMSWEWVQPILDAFKENLLPLHLYEAGSNGPDAAESLLKADGFKWWLDEVDLEENEENKSELEFITH